MAGLGIEQETNDALTAAASRAAEAAPGVAAETDLVNHASPANALVEAGQDALMLVIGSRGAGGFTALVLGSVSRYAATNAACPVVVVREETTSAHGEIVVGVHDPAQATTALGFAFEEAALRQAKLVATHARARLGVWPGGRLHHPLRAQPRAGPGGIRPRPVMAPVQG